jgi:hypothetical protein
MQQSLQETSGFVRQNSVTKTTHAPSKTVARCQKASKPIAFAPQESGFASSAMMLGTL